MLVSFVYYSVILFLMYENFKFNKIFKCIKLLELSLKKSV